MPYEILLFEPRVGLNLQPKVAKNIFREKRLHPDSADLINDEIERIFANPNAFNGEKALFYFKDDADRSVLKIVPEDYASVLASAKLGRSPQEGKFLRPHYAAGVIVVCKTSDNKIVIGSRDASRSKLDPTDYPLQFPCGFIDVNEEFYQVAQSGDSVWLNDELIKNAKRELREEVLNFSDEQLTKSQSIGAIYETKQWPTKAGGIKDVHVIKSFVVAVEVSLSAQEILEKREAAILELNRNLELERSLPSNEERLKYLEVQKKDFDEMTQMGFVEFSRLSLILGSGTGREAEILFEGKNRKFVAEHGMALDLVARPRTSVVGALVEEEKDSRSI